MKRTITLWLLICLLLCGCSAAPAESPTTVPTETAAPPTQDQEEQYAPGNDIEWNTQGAVRSYPLPMDYCQGFAVMGDGILILSDGDSGTTLTVLSGDTLNPTAQRTLDTYLYDQAASIQADAKGLSYFDEHTRETVILDESLREITRIPAPEGLTGYPQLSADRQTLYYCTTDSICAMDLQTRLSQVLRLYTGAEMVLDGLHMDGTVLKCFRYDKGWHTYFLSAEDGQLLHEAESWYTFASQGERYILSFQQENYTNLLFGTGNSTPQALYIPATDLEPLLLEKSCGILSITAESDIRMDYYDLSTGRLASTLTLEGDCVPSVADGGEGVLWLLNTDPLGLQYTLYRWDTKALPSGDDTVYTDAWYTRSSPDLNGIARCQELAQEISLRHGVEVLVWEDAIAAEPWDYNLTEEYLVPVLERQLTLLDQWLGNFPQGFFETLAEDCSGLTICLVRSVQGDSDYGTVSDASGLQFWIEDHAYIALSTAAATEGSLYHELCHVMDTRIYSHSNAYDQWEALNPGGFAYDYDYAANAQRNAGEYLRDAQRYFIDTYSMSFPKEDRARILEYAMTEGNEHYFQSDSMQSKLKQICIGIREAFGLKKNEEVFLWEQYLNESLAYSK